MHYGMPTVHRAVLGPNGKS